MTNNKNKERKKRNETKLNNVKIMRIALYSIFDQNSASLTNQG